ncbi:MAG: type II secretion system protein, partial [Elusimicrobiota bacterium]
MIDGMKKSAFTLVELIVALVIVGLLASLGYTYWIKAA